MSNKKNRETGEAGELQKELAELRERLTKLEERSEGGPRKTVYEGFFRVGTNYMIRTVTNYFVGRCVSVHPDGLVLEDASWVAWTKRYSTIFTEGADGFDEVERIIGPEFVSGVVDAHEYPFSVPVDTK